MRVIVFDLGGTLMEYEDMPYSWIDYYEYGLQKINKKYNCNKTAYDISKSVDILKAYNPRIQYREKEISPEFIFSKVLEHWNIDIAVKDCVYTFFEGLQLNTKIYSDTVSTLTELRNRKYSIATLTDLPTAMPDELFKRDIAQLLKYFDLYVSSSTCGFRKPNYMGLRLIAEYFNVSITELIFVGDEEKDRKTAQNANCKFVYVDRSGNNGIRNLHELLNILN